MSAHGSQAAIPTRTKLLQVTQYCLCVDLTDIVVVQAAFQCSFYTRSRICKAAMSAAEADHAEVEDELADLYMLSLSGDFAQVG